MTRLLVMAEQEVPVLRNMADLLLLAKKFEARQDDEADGCVHCLGLSAK